MRTIIILATVAFFAFPDLATKAALVVGLSYWQSKVSQLIDEHLSASCSSPRSTEEHQSSEQPWPAILPADGAKPATNRAPQSRRGNLICQQPDKKKELECLESIWRSMNQPNLSDNS